MTLCIGLKKLTEDLKYLIYFSEPLCMQMIKYYFPAFLLNSFECMIDIRIQLGKKMGISFGCLKSYCMAYRPHKAGYIHSTVLSLGEYKLE